MLIAKIALAHASEILGCYKLLDGETLENYIVWPSPPLVLSVVLRSTFHSRFACPLTAFLGRLGSRSWRSLNKGENPKSETNKKWGKRVKSLETESEAKAAQKPLCSRELSFVSQSGTKLRSAAVRDGRPTSCSELIRMRWPVELYFARLALGFP
ncbi:hypothetical protein OUZ56_028544 [Daphnia magna]|uniref:Uncharacterized protein n=1 Tax=Daphnia magna TaxID=35525 RepID=A0ABR0B464_9CRUS|nr:hypothetical protein OUZ56_028544 [Daphnia magna]